jgi:hypothetical protein
MTEARMCTDPEEESISIGVLGRRDVREAALDSTVRGGVANSSSLADPSGAARFLEEVFATAFLIELLDFPARADIKSRPL